MIVGPSTHQRIKVLILRHVVYAGEVPLSNSKLFLIGKGYSLQNPDTITYTSNQKPFIMQLIKHVSL